MHPISESLFGIYRVLYAKGQVSFPLLDTQKNRLDSIVKTVNSSFFGVNRFPTEEDKAAAYFVLIIKDHPLTDGNKRTAVLWLEVYTEAMELKTRLPEGLTMDELAVGIEKLPNLDNDELMFLAKYLLFAEKD